MDAVAVASIAVVKSKRLWSIFRGIFGNTVFLNPVELC